MHIWYTAHFRLIKQYHEQEVCKYLMIYLNMFCIKTKVNAISLSILIQVYCALPSHNGFKPKLT